MSDTAISKCQSCGQEMHPTDYVDRLREALKESLKLQSHYAVLLNQYDGGKRIGFKSAKAWLNRLSEVAKAAGKAKA